MKIVRGSEVSDFLRCRYRWAERWINKLEEIRPNDKLFFGTLFHKFVEVYYKDRSYNDATGAMDYLFDQQDKRGMEQVEIDALWDLAVKVTRGYVDQWNGDRDMNILATELHIIIPLDNDIAVEGTIDLVYEDKDGLLWFMDHKTTAAIDKYEKNAAMDRQISRYWWMLQQLTKGIGMIEKDGQWVPFKDTLDFLKIRYKEVAGFIYNIVLRDAPVEPKVLKGGGLSTDKRQKTTHDLYWKELKHRGLIDENGFAPAEYHEILDHLASYENDFGNRFFRRVPVFRGQHEVNAAMMEFYHTALDVHDVERAIKDGQTQLAYRNITNDCTWDCPFKTLCHATIAGDDAVSIRNIMYKVGE